MQLAAARLPTLFTGATITLQSQAFFSSLCLRRPTEDATRSCSPPYSVYRHDENFAKSSVFSSLCLRRPPYAPHLFADNPLSPARYNTYQKGTTCSRTLVPFVSCRNGCFFEASKSNAAPIYFARFTAKFARLIFAFVRLSLASVSWYWSDFFSVRPTSAPRDS